MLSSFPPAVEETNFKRFHIQVFGISVLNLKKFRSFKLNLAARNIREQSTILDITPLTLSSPIMRRLVRDTIANSIVIRTQEQSYRLSTIDIQVGLF